MTPEEVANYLKVKKKAIDDYPSFEKRLNEIKKKAV